MAKMRKFAFISALLLPLILVSHVAYSRTIPDGSNSVSDGSGSYWNTTSSLLELKLSATTENCEPIYGFLPCSSNGWGLLFLIVVYEILLSIGGQYVGKGSNMFFEIIGPGVFGASLFQLLSTVPQIVLVLQSSLSGSPEAAQQRATLGMGLVAGTTVMLLTLIWGLSVILGSYDLSVNNAPDITGSTNTVLQGLGVVTDVETSYTARIMVFTLAPFVVLLFAKFFSHTGRRVVILIALILTIALLVGYILYQIFQPWVQNRRFEYLISKYAKDKLLRLFSRNGRPDTLKIRRLFKQIDKNNNASVSAAELRVLLLGVKMDDKDLSKDRDVEQILSAFDTSGDAGINEEEFVKVMTQLVNDLSSSTAFNTKKSGSVNSQSNTQGAQQPLLASTATTGATQRATKSWINYLTAAFYVIIGTVMLCAFAEPMIKSTVFFAQAANLPSFAVSYLAIPFAMNYGVAVQSLATARQKTRDSISLTLSMLYGGVYMNNIIGLIVFLGPVYGRDLWADVSTEIVVVLIICIFMTIFTSLRTTYPRWVGYVVLLLYPISLAVIYFLTSVLGLP